MTVAVCAVVLAAGEGRRLRPLTELRPKALCPVGNVPLLDRALSLVEDAGFAGPDRLAVNACWLADQVLSHVDGRATVSVEPDEPLGTAGGIGRLRDWIDGRAVLVGNADAYLASPVGFGARSVSSLASPPRDPAGTAAYGISALLHGWSGDSVRILGVPGDEPEFGAHRFAGFSLLPPGCVARLRAEPSDLVREVWRPAEREGELEVIEYPGLYLDTGTPARYLAANLHAAGGRALVAPGAAVTGELNGAVVGTGATVRGRLTRSVVWDGGYVAEDEHLVEAIRVGRDLTVQA